MLQEFTTARLEIQGHTDDAPVVKGSKFADNHELSHARAETVRQYFVTKGVADARLTAKGFADEVPVVEPKGLKGGKLTAARAKNRRVEFKLVTNEAPPTPEAPPAPPADAPAATP